MLRLSTVKELIETCQTTKKRCAHEVSGGYYKIGRDSRDGNAHVACEQVIRGVHAQRLRVLLCLATRIVTALQKEASRDGT